MLIHKLYLIIPSMTGHHFTPGAGQGAWGKKENQLNRICNGRQDIIDNSIITSGAYTMLCI